MVFTFSLTSLRTIWGCCPSPPHFYQLVLALSLSRLIAMRTLVQAPLYRIVSTCSRCFYGLTELDILVLPPVDRSDIYTEEVSKLFHGGAELAELLSLCGVIRVIVRWTPHICSDVILLLSGCHCLRSHEVVIYHIRWIWYQSLFSSSHGMKCLL